MSNRKAYREIARKHGISIAEVKREMQAAINHAYQNTPNDGITGVCQNSIQRKGEIPTVDEVVNYAKEKLKNADNT